MGEKRKGKRKTQTRLPDGRDDNQIPADRFCLALHEKKRRREKKGSKKTPE